MLKVIQGGGTPNGKSSRANVRMAVTASLPRKRMSPEDMLSIAVSSGHIDDDVHTLIDTFPSVKEFSTKLAELITHTFPATSDQYPSLLTEVLDLAMIGYIQASSKEPREQIARFLANGVFATTQGITTYLAAQVRDGEQVAWIPWDDGSLADWAVWGAPVEFIPEAAPTPELRHATSTMLQQRLLSWQSVVNIARAGIDLKTSNLF